MYALLDERIFSKYVPDKTVTMASETIDLTLVQGMRVDWEGPGDEARNEGDMVNTKSWLSMTDLINSL